MKSRICVALGEKTKEKVLEKISPVVTYSDVVEIRLDYLDAIEVDYFLDELTIPLLFTNRASWEGGLSTLPEDLRIKPLIAAMTKNAAYVDLELAAPEHSLEKLIEQKNSSTTNIILSSHDFDKTPSQVTLEDKILLMKEKGADIGKIITTANHWQDCLTVLSLQQFAAEISLPLIAFCMGSIGQVSRVATCGLGGYMTYCSAPQSEGTAPGQIGADILKAFNNECGKTD